MQGLNAKLREQNALLERMNAELHALATSDSLTGLRNRRYLLKTGEDEFARARRLKHELALLLIDIDWFKRVNDTLGHVAGDEVIRAVARRCSDGTRAHVDTVIACRERLTERLRGLGGDVPPSDTNFIAVRLADAERAASIHRQLLDAGTLVHRPAHPALGHVLRISTLAAALEPGRLGALEGALTA